MSSIRIDSLRLVWLETFVQVAENENISAAARELGCDQSTVSRHMKALHEWSGKTLIEPGKVNDPDNPDVNVAITEDGRQLYELAEPIIEELTAFRTEKARRNEVLDRMGKMLATMQADLQGNKPSETVLSVADKVKLQERTLHELREVHDLPLLEAAYHLCRRFFATYEDQLNRERRKKRRPRATSAAHIDMSRYKDVTS